MTVTTNEIRIPSWVVSVIMPLAIGVITYVIGLSTINAKTSTQIDHLHNEVIRLDAGKASQDKVNAVESTLESVQGTVIRIEQKLDKHISDGGK